MSDEIARLNDMAMCGDCFDRGWVWEGEGSDLSNQFRVPCHCKADPVLDEMANNRRRVEAESRGIALS